MPDQTQNQDPTILQQSVGTSNVPFHRHGGPDGPLIPLNNVSGSPPMVTALPTSTPTGSIATGMAFDSTTGVIYYYDLTNKAWKATATDAHIRGLLSGTAPIAYNSSTGVISFNGTSQLLESFTAGESISTGNAVAIGPYQTTPITFDTDNVYTATPSGNQISTTFNVGNNANRLLVVFLYKGYSGGAMTYNGVAMNSAFSTVTGASSGYLDGFYLVAPTVGNNTLTITGLNNGAGGVPVVGIYSYYNVDQVTPIAQAVTQNFQNTAVSLATTPTKNASVLLSCATFTNSTSQGTSTNMNNNTNTTADANNDKIFLGDSFTLANTAPVTVTFSASQFWDVATLELNPVQTASFRVFKANTTSTGYNTNWKSDAFIGFSQSTVSAGGSASVLLAGTDANQSSLSVGAHYYLGSSGAIALTGTRKAGIATAVGEVLITNIW